MNDADADGPAAQGAIDPGTAVGQDVAVPAGDLGGSAGDPGEPLIGFSASADELSTGDGLAQALLQLGEGHGIDTLDTGGPLASDAGHDMSDVGAAGAALDDLGSMLDQLGPSLDALVSEVNLFDISIPGDFLGDA